MQGTIYVHKLQHGTITGSRVHLNFRAGSTFPVSVCTVPPGRGQQSWSSSVYRTSWCNEVDAVRLYTSIG